jgi:hypothetical protein
MPSVRWLLPFVAAVVVGALACDPHYEPPPKGPETVYIPWQAGPARGPRRAAGAPSVAPSSAPSVEIEDVDSDGGSGDDAASTSDAPAGG